MELKMKISLTPTQKREMLQDLIIISDRTGYDISNLIGYSLSNFNWLNVFDALVERNEDYKSMNNECYFEHRERDYLRY